MNKLTDTHNVANYYSKRIRIQIKQQRPDLGNSYIIIYLFHSPADRYGLGLNDSPDGAPVSTRKQICRAVSSACTHFNSQISAATCVNLRSATSYSLQRELTAQIFGVGWVNCQLSVKQGFFCGSLIYFVMYASAE